MAGHNGSRISKTLYAAGLVVATVCSFYFYLSFYGRGGVLEIEDGAHYLLNHGRKTPISEGYAHAVESSLTAFLIGTPVVWALILPWFVRCIKDARRAGGHSPWSFRGSVLLWAKLFLPLPSDLGVVRVTKTWFLLVFGFIVACSLWDSGTMPEGQYIDLGIAVYLGLLPVSLLLALVLLRPRGGPCDRHAEGRRPPPSACQSAS